MRVSRSVDRSAATSSRQTGCEEGSPATRSDGALAEARLVLRMHRHAAAEVLEDCAEALVVADEEIAGGRTHEHLDAGGAGQALKLADVGGVFLRAADEEGEVAMHAARGALDLVGERGFGDCQRVGVGHLEDGRDAAHDGGERTRLEIFLVLGAGLAEMDLRVDDAWQDVQPRAVDRLAGHFRAERADGGDAPVRARRYRAAPRRPG